jgi:MFS family permease
MRSLGRSISPADRVLGRKLDSIPFSPYHLMLISVLALVGFVDGYDLVMTGSLLVLAKQPLHLGPSEIWFLAIASTMMICVGGFIASAISDHYSRKTAMPSLSCSAGDGRSAGNGNRGVAGAGLVQKEGASGLAPSRRRNYAFTEV